MGAGDDDGGRGLVKTGQAFADEESEDITNATVYGDVELGDFDDSAALLGAHDRDEYY